MAEKMKLQQIRIASNGGQLTFVPADTPDPEPGKPQQPPTKILSLVVKDPQIAQAYKINQVYNVTIEPETV